MSTALSFTKLFVPIKVGDHVLSHRAVFAPTTRKRCTDLHVATDIMVDYYAKRSQFPGTLVIMELTLVSETTGLTPNKPGAFSEPQLRGLKVIFDAIHLNKSFVSVQLVAVGRLADLDLARSRNLPVVAPSPVYVDEKHKARFEKAGLEIEQLSVAKIAQIQNEYVDAAVGCIKHGADFVEVHGTSGFLVEQFLLPLSNFRQDKYGGSIENRARFLLEIIHLLVNHPQVGPSKVAVRIAPWSSFNMNYPDYENPSEHPGFQMSKYLMAEFEKMRSLNQSLAYVSICEPRVSGNSDVGNLQGLSNSPVIQLWSGPIVRAGGYATNFAGGPSVLASNHVNFKDGKPLHYEQLIKDVEADDRTLIAFSRPFTSNPDLVHRLKEGIELTVYEREFFYTGTKRGYNAYGNHGETVVIPESELDERGVAVA